MRKHLFFGLLLATTFCGKALAQSDYPTLSQTTQRIQKLSANPAVELKTLTKTAGGKEIYALKIGTGAKDQKPAIAVVGGVEGFHVLGVELALQFAEKLVGENAKALESTTFYVFPNLSPDAYAQYHAALKYERRGNAVAMDHDRDGTPGDNGYSDLNGDGMITWMRVSDPMKALPSTNHSATNSPYLSPSQEILRCLNSKAVPCWTTSLSSGIFLLL